MESTQMENKWKPKKYCESLKEYIFWYLKWFFFIEMGKDLFSYLIHVHKTNSFNSENFKKCLFNGINVNM